MNYKGLIEGILFVVGDEGITLKKLSEIIELSEDETKENLSLLQKAYENDDRGIRISFLGNAFKLTTKSIHKKYYEKLVIERGSQTLSTAALEVLAIIAYNEPITRIKVDELRGVNSVQIIRKLVSRNFIKECGKDKTIGRPNLYKTTNEFLDYFGLASKNDLPTLEMIQEEDNEVDLYKSNYKEEKE